MITFDPATQPTLGFDLETTGVNAFEDRIIQAAIVRHRPGQDPETFTWLVDPGVGIPEEASAVHGYTRERLTSEATHTVEQMLFEVAGHLATAMGHKIPVVVANAAYDLTMLEAENQRHGIDTIASRVAPFPIGPVLDPMVLDKEADPYRKGICAEARTPCPCGATNKTLSSLCLHYGVDLGQAHDAGADALAAAMLVPAIVGRFPDKFRGLSVGGLHMAQVGWAKAQKDSLRAYFDRNGTEHDGCDPAWPVRTAPVPVRDEQGALL